MEGAAGRAILKCETTTLSAQPANNTLIYPDPVAVWLVWLERFNLFVPDFGDKTNFVY